MSFRPTLLIALSLLALSDCAQRSQIPVSSLGDDDDAICRANNVAVGSPEYVACRKDRDVIRSNAAARADRRQRDLGEYMLNHPDHP
jgi:DICT domain-containing protein